MTGGQLALLFLATFIAGWITGGRFGFRTGYTRGAQDTEMELLSAELEKADRDER